ncbi:hypothetical protein HEP81_07781 [Streptomyces griseofuscus]|uniref:Uncharacterized protein n=1 Tax=Streptomyces griseofuscus TaxID=146922 RepID=A0A7H1QCI1_9ACTN|nr:hypothetical protein HEP81_07781 [Streptomyces griseofuscus]
MLKPHTTLLRGVLARYEELNLRRARRENIRRTKR